MKKLTLALVLAAAALPARAEDINLAGVLINTQDPFWQTIGCGAQAKAAELGVKLELFTSTTMDAGQLTAAFDAAMLTSPKGFFGTPTAANQFATQYAQMMEAGVPVVTGNATDPAAQYQVIWSSGDTAPYLDDLLKLVKATEGQMVVLGGIPGLYPLEMRYKPLVEALKAAKPGLSEIEPIFTTFDVNKATSSVSAALIANPDLKLIIASNGPDAIGAAAAVKAAGLVGKVQIVAFDAVPPEVEALKEGTITALIAQSPLQIGAQSVAALVDYVKAGHDGAVPVSSELVGIPQRLLTAETVDDPANADYVYKATCE